jgi:hypothetical protein
MNPINRFLIIPFCLILVFLSGCKQKTVIYTIQGNVKDLSFNQGLANATIRVTIAMSGGASGGSIKTYSTDSNGDYSFSFERDRIESITIEVEKDNYFSKSIVYSLDDLTVKTPTTSNFSLYAKAWVKLHFLGDGTTTYRYSKQDGLSNCAECCPGTEQTFTNVSNESVYCINNGGANYQVFWYIPSTTFNGQVSAITPAFDTTELVISF